MIETQTELFEREKPSVATRLDDIATETYELMAEARRDILAAYLNDDVEGDFSLSFSAGKDSTLTLKLVFEALESLPNNLRKRMIHVVCSDTMVETPLVHEHMVRQVEQIGEYIERKSMPATVRIVSRVLKNGYFAGIIGSGYRLPDNKSRYCTDKLKLTPQDAFLNEMNPPVVMSGVRSSESERRHAAYQEKWTNNKHRPSMKMFFPILNFTVDHVWEALKAPLPWGSSIYVRNIYKEATGECGFQNPKATDKPKVDACGARFGCWVCPVIMADKSTEQMTIHHPWLEPLTRWRELHMQVAGQYDPPKEAGMNRRDRVKQLRMWEEIKKVVRYISKSGTNRKGDKLQPGWGTLTIEVRKYLLETLLQTEEEVNELRAESNLEPIKLIADEEVNFILNQIAEDERERPWLSNGCQDFGRVFERKVNEIKAYHHKHWNEEVMRCPNCGKRMKIIRPGVQACRKCKSKARQVALDI